MLNDIVEQLRIKQQKHIRETHLQPLQKFVSSLEGMPIPHEYLHGKLLIAGVGAFMPERAWLCTAESDYRELGEQVNRVVVADRMFKLDKQLFTEGSLAKVEHHGMDVEDLLNSTPAEEFDAITFMRISDFANQLHLGTLERFAKALKPGGVFIGSGSTKTMWNNFYYKEQTFQHVGEDLGLELLSFNRLADVDHNGFPYYANAGVVFKKKEPN